MLFCLHLLANSPTLLDYALKNPTTKLLKAIQKFPICGAEYAFQAWDASLPEGKAGSKVFWRKVKVPTFPDTGEEKVACLVLVQRQGIAWLCLGR